MPKPATPLPRILYHGSAFKSAELQPAFNITGKKVEWDEIESNEWLYATTNANLAIAMAVASLLSQSYIIDMFQMDDLTNEIVVTLAAKSPVFNLFTFKQSTVYLYTMRPLKTQKWEKVAATERKGENTEWKTKSVLKTFSVIPIRVFDWARTKKITIKHANKPVKSFGTLSLEDDSKLKRIELRII